jgi:hypothetical protein
MRTGIIGLAILIFGMSGAAAEDHIRATGRFRPVNELPPQDRLEIACDVAGDLRDDLKGRKLGEETTSHMNALLDLVCAAPIKPAQAKPRP